jgi:predicted transcriptional regulator of viral defense system
MRRPEPPRGRVRLAAVLREAKGLVTVDDAVRALRVERRDAAKLLARWVEQGWLRRARRGVYVPVALDAAARDRSVENPWLFVPQLFAPGYVGGWSAAEHWGLTEQVFRSICVFSARPFRSKRVRVEGTDFILHRTSEDALFGTSMLWVERTRVLISDVDRTLVDMLSRPVTGGGIRNVDACLSAWLVSPRHNADRLIDYADQLGNGAVFKRLGFLLSLRRTADSVLIDACRTRLSSGNARLDPRLTSAHLVSRWRLWVPRGWSRALTR